MSPGCGRLVVLRSLLAAVLLAVARPSVAQTLVTLHLDSLFYADNTEFDGPFRSGETILGAWQRIFFDIAPSDRVTVQLGLFTTERAGSPSPVDHALPIVALRLGTARHRFILGTLDSPDRRRAFGPDRTTPHGLLPPLAVETQWFTRAYEAGAQWLTRTAAYSHDVWFGYQATNTPEHREKFDIGAVGRARIAGPLAVGYQFHVVHHGGQQFDHGPVSDSVALGPGLIVEGPLGRLTSASLEVFGLAARDRPDRASPSRTVNGKAVLVRAVGQVRRWRGHLIAWRGDDFNHEDGDPNYLSRFPDGTRYARTRDYAEIGLAKLFQPAAGVDLEASFRLHRIEASYAYSYRLLGTVHFTLWETRIAPPAR
jgi:hypothetical protein